MSPGSLRCPYCRSSLGEAQHFPCPVCRTEVHRACWNEHGGCPILGCAGRPPTEGRSLEPAQVPWPDFVREAEPWLALGASLWWGESPGEEDVGARAARSAAARPSGSGSTPSSDSASRAA